MWPFCSKKKIVNQDITVVEPQKPKLKLIHKEEEFDVGRTIIHLTFETNERFDVWIYGTIDQYIQKGNSVYNQYVMEIRDPKIDSSKNKVKSCMLYGVNYINECRNFLDRHNNILFTDDSKNPSTSIYGTVVKMEVGRTESYLEKFNVASLVDE